MEKFIKLNIEDINTGIYGNNIVIKTDGDMDIIFSHEALDELMEDYKSIKEELLKKEEE